MQAMVIIAWVNFAIAGVLAFAATNRAPGLLSPAIMAAVSGCLFLAIDKALTLLAEIRDRLPAPEVKPAAAPSQLPEGTLTRSLSEIEADLERMKGKMRT